MTIQEVWNTHVEEHDDYLNPRRLFALAYPEFDVKESDYPGTGWLPDFIPIAFEDIEKWEDFNATTVNDAMRSILDEGLPEPRGPVTRAVERLDVTIRIEVEEDLDNFFLDVIAPIVRHALYGIQAKLFENTRNRHAFKIVVPFEKDASKVKLPQYAASRNIEQHRKRPNFPIYVPAHSVRACNPSPDVIHVIGDSARTKSLHPKYSFRRKGLFGKCGKNHLGKMAMYAKGSGTCLAFTMTHVGVTVFRFFIVDGTSRLGVQQRTFPWNSVSVPGEGITMSGTKAIYALMVMSLFPEGRTIRERSELRSIADWPHFQMVVNVFNILNNSASVRVCEMAGLPNVEGPKLMPFIPLGSPYDLEFLEFIGGGEHGYVWKVSINGEVYALKMFRFDDRFTPTHLGWNVDLPKKEQRTWMYAFNCECRAYARLKEVNKEFVAIPCFGYLLLGEEHQAALRKKDSLDWEEDWGFSKEHKGQPLQALVKKFIEYEHVSERDFNPGHNYRRTRMAFDSAATARKLIRNMKILHRAGILNNDINCMNAIQGQFLEFSSAFTTPHPCLATEHIEAQDYPYEHVGKWDASQVDDLIDVWNQTNPMKRHIWDRAAPNWQYQEEKLRSHQHPPDWRDDIWNWNRGYSLRPDKFRWDKIGKTREYGLGEAKKPKSQQKKDKKNSKPTKKNKSKLERDTAKDPAPTARQTKHESKDKKKSKRKKKTDVGFKQ